MKNGTNSSGNLEIYHNNVWGAVCDLGFTSQAADVACRQLGFIGMQDYYCCSAFGFHYSTFWLHGLNCKGDESRLMNCNYLSIDSTCNYNNVAGVHCRGKYLSNDIKLYTEKTTY